LKHSTTWLLCAALLSGCGEDFERYEVSGISFCPPKRNLIEIGAPWVPSDMPSGPGFAFTARLSSGFETNGHVMRAEQSTAFNTPDPKAYLWQTITSSDAIQEHVSGTRFYEAKNPLYPGLSSIVWEPKGGIRPPASLNDRLIATCDAADKKVLDRVIPASCTRIASLQGMQFSYHFPKKFLADVSRVDESVVQMLNGWKCR